MIPLYAHHGSSLGASFAHSLVRGAGYRVAEVALAACRRCRMILPCLVPTSPSLGQGAWPQVCFRKVEPADEDVFSLADAAPRVRVPEPV